MSVITPSSLAQFIHNQLDGYFTDFHKDELEKKILAMTLSVERMMPVIVKIDPCLKDKFDKWQQNSSILEKILYHLEELEQKSPDKTGEVDDIVLCLKAVISDCEVLFPNKTVAMKDWSMHKEYLNNVISLLRKEDSDRKLTCDEVITFLNLTPLNQCTSELGYYKEFTRSTDKSEGSFTKIFYLLKNDEKSYFHKLDTTETWKWLGNCPLSLFMIENEQLTEHVLCESNQIIIVPRGTWFSAMLKNEDEHNQVEDEIPFALVTCLCVPAFTLSCFHDDITASEEAWTVLFDAYEKAKKTNIIELLTPQYQGELKKRVCQSE